MDVRAYRRVSVDRDIRCQAGSATGWVVLYDLSAGGAMIEVGGLSIEVGDEIQLNLHDLITASGKIAWKIEGNAGVKFSGILAGSIVEHLGFSSSALTFDELAPRSRSGEVLPELLTASTAPSAPSSCDSDPSPSNWQETAMVREDRRLSDRGDECRRQEERLAIDAKAKLSISIREGVEGRMIDLSTAGCSFLDPTNSFRTGDEVWLKMEALELWRGTVRWTKGEKVGIEFKRPFYPAVLNHLVELHQGVVVSKAA